MLGADVREDLLAELCPGTRFLLSRFAELPDTQRPLVPVFSMSALR